MNLGLFKKADTEEYFYKFNTEETPSQDRLKMAYFFGEASGKAFLERVTVPIYFDHTITRYLLGQQSKIEDLFTYDKHVSSMNVVE